MTPGQRLGEVRPLEMMTKEARLERQPPPWRRVRSRSRRPQEANQKEAAATVPRQAALPLQLPWKASSAQRDFAGAGDLSTHIDFIGCGHACRTGGTTHKQQRCYSASVLPDTQGKVIGRRQAAWRELAQCSHFGYTKSSMPPLPGAGDVKLGDKAARCTPGYHARPMRSAATPTAPSIFNTPG
jgi:hypothetical protein